MRKKLVEFTGFHGIDSGENIRQVLDRIDLVTLARDNEGQVNCHGPAAGVGANEQKVLARKNEVFDRALGAIVVDVEVGIAEEPV